MKADPFSLLDARCLSVAARDNTTMESFPVVVGASVVAGVCEAGVGGFFTIRFDRGGRKLCFNFLSIISI